MNKYILIQILNAIPFIASKDVLAYYFLYDNNFRTRLKRYYYSA